MAKVFCLKLQIESNQLEFAPYPGELGQKILKNISQEAWDLWLGHQTILINEYRLNMLDKEARKFLKIEMEKFLFSEENNITMPTQFTEPDS